MVRYKDKPAKVCQAYDFDTRNECLSNLKNMSKHPTLCSNNDRVTEWTNQLPWFSFGPFPSRSLLFNEQSLRRSNDWTVANVTALEVALLTFDVPLYFLPTHLVHTSSPFKLWTIDALEAWSANLRIIYAICYSQQMNQLVILLVSLRSSDILPLPP